MQVLVVRKLHVNDVMSICANWENYCNRSFSKNSADSRRLTTELHMTSHDVNRRIVHARQVRTI